jgi:hypothetical protein
MGEARAHQTVLAIENKWANVRQGSRASGTWEINIGAGLLQEQMIVARES